MIITAHKPEQVRIDDLEIGRIAEHAVRRAHDLEPSDIIKDGKVGSMRWSDSIHSEYFAERRVATPDDKAALSVIAKIKATSLLRR